MKSEFPKKIRLGDSVDKQNCSKPAQYVKTRGLQKRRNETGWQSKVVLLNAELHLGRVFTHAALESLLQWLHRHHALVIMFSSSDWTTVHTSQMCKLPILSVFFIPSRFTTTSLVYLHRFTDSSLEFSTVQSCPCLVPLPLTCGCPCSYACNLNPCMAPNRTPWQDSIISCIIFVSHSLQSGALPLCLGDHQPIPSA